MALPIVVFLSVLIALGVGVLVNSVLSSVSVTQSMLQRRRVFYGCDGVGRVVQQLARNYLDNTPVAPSAAGMEVSVKAAAGGDSLPNIMPAGFTGTKFKVDAASVNIVKPVPSGPFQGLNARMDEFTYRLECRQTALGTRSAIAQTFSVGRIGLFQFFYFSDGYADWIANDPTTVTGRVHANGDFCLLENFLALERVTASGRIMNLADGRCIYSAAGTDPTILNPNDSIYYPLLDIADNGCGPSCNGSGKAWEAYAESTWGGAVKDEAHAVRSLRLPTAGMATVQNGADKAGVPVDNRNSLRMVLDPPRPGDSDQVLDEKLAIKADIRIVDGVWYLANPANRRAWPGTAIWSDHPGEARFTPASFGMLGADPLASPSVGHRTLSTAQAWGGVVPRQYSYYPYDDTGPKLLFSPNLSWRPVVSYGSIIFDIDGLGNTVWQPGHYKSTGVFSQATQNGCGTGAAPWTAPGIQEVSACLLNATRSGFRDGHVQKDSGFDAALQHSANILPLNFDVAALASALTNPGVGELRSYFAGAGRTFNGIVYITSTWLNMDVGYGGGPTVAPPGHGELFDRTGLQQLFVSTTAVHTLASEQQGAIPSVFCSENTGYVPSGLAGTEMPFLVPGVTPNRFHVPPCGGYGAVDSFGPGAGPYAADPKINAVRIINGGDLGAFANGLTIATNLPVYIVGPFNSVVPANWKPALVAGDNITLLSSWWKDELAPWDRDTNLNVRQATDTAFHVALLGGTVRSSAGQYGGGVSNFALLLEDWASPGATLSFKGSMVSGFASVYRQKGWRGVHVRTFTEPLHDFSADSRLADPNAQPPGAPMFTVYGVKDWRKDY